VFVCVLKKNKENTFSLFLSLLYLFDRLGGHVSLIFLVPCSCG